MKLLLMITLAAVSADVSAPQSIPAGVVLPARLDTTLSSSRSKPGQLVQARVMQPVPLPDGSVIPTGSKLQGHVIRVSGPAGTGPAVAFQFDTLKTSRAQVRLTVSLRALASFMALQDAQDPAMGADRGTASVAYTTIQVGGDVVYRGGGPVMNGGDVVGQPVADGVLVQLRANPLGGCRGNLEPNERPQALWLFASDACGAYGLPGLSIAQTGRGNPPGEIVLTASGGELRLQRGSGMLLRVIPPGA